jgi:hypothetical protein
MVCATATSSPTDQQKVWACDRMTMHSKVFCKGGWLCSSNAVQKSCSGKLRTPATVATYSGRITADPETIHFAASARS